MPPEAAGCQVVHCAAGGNGSGKNVWRWRVFEGKGEGISEQTYCVFSELSGGSLSLSLSLSLSVPLSLSLCLSDEGWSFPSPFRLARGT